MVGVVMGEQHQRGGPSLIIKGLQDWLGLWHVDYCGHSRGRIMRDIGIVISQAGDSKDLQNHGIFPIAG